jgi:BirA family biotin operon repressor/biotin-[acetyl-CoA-carboxylase] ligase
MNQPREIWQLPLKWLGRRVLVYDRLDSTNNAAAELAGDPSSAGIAILAQEQTAGRGQHGRTWLAAPSSSVLLSLLLFPPANLRRPAILTAWAAVAVCTLIQKSIGRQVRIKWPNDVYLAGQKVCGILIEQGRGTVVGIGLNVQQRPEDFARAELPEATSLAIHAAGPLETAEIARRLLEQLDADYDLLQSGDLNTLESCWKWHLGLLGRTVRVECPDKILEGRLLELGFDGVQLQTGEGMLCLPPERVQHLQQRE